MKIWFAPVFCAGGTFCRPTSAADVASVTIGMHYRKESGGNKHKWGSAFAAPHFLTLNYALAAWPYHLAISASGIAW